MKNFKRFFLYLTAVFVLGLAGSQITVPGATATTCCEFGSQCGGLKCCLPGFNEAPCSANRKNYCRASCSAVSVPVDPAEPIGGDTPVQP